jgi:multidrug transporter EmrE-like cation transporter
LLSPAVVAGLCLYGIGTAMWLHALVKIELSQAYPFVGFSFVLTALAGWWLFGEALTAQRTTGIALVVAGVTLVAFVKAKNPSKEAGAR